MPGPKPMFETKVSLFENLGASPVSITLREWIDLNRCKNRYTDLIINYRNSGDALLKKSLPLVTVGGVFETGRKLDNLVSRTNWVAIDIDRKDNLHLPNADEIRNQVANISYVAFSCLSVSGDGVWCLIKISDSKKQALHFEQLKRDFKSVKINLDPSKGKNANDARFLSYDPKAIIKENFKVYDWFPKNSKKRQSSESSHQSLNRSTELSDIIKRINKGRVDIAPDYDTYRNIGFALASEYGESGRGIFHEVVCHSPKYNQRDADKQFSNGLRSDRQGITMGTFFYYCKLRGLI